MIGAGVMGSGIAAQIANAGVPVLLLDVVPEGADDRNALAKGALERMLKAEPAPFMSRQAARGWSPRATSRTTSSGSPTWTGSSRRSSRTVEVKQALYARLEGVRKPARSSPPTPRPCRSPADRGTARELPARLPDHPLLQSAALHAAAGGRRRADDPAREAVEAITHFADLRLGKGVVCAKDTPGLHRQPDRHLLAAGGDRPRRSSWA